MEGEEAEGLGFTIGGFRVENRVCVSHALEPDDPQTWIHISQNLGLQFRV